MDCVSTCAMARAFDGDFRGGSADLHGDFDASFLATLRAIIALASNFLKPGADSVRSYLPGLRAVTAHSPSVLLVVFRTMPRSALVTVTPAFATMAPDGSFTEPTREADGLTECSGGYEENYEQTSQQHETRFHSSSIHP